LAANYFFSLSHRLWRYASAGEIVVIAAAVSTGTALLTLADLFWPDRRPVPLSVVWMTGLFASVGFVSVRYRRRVWTGFRWRWRALRGEFPLARTLWNLCNLWFWIWASVLLRGNKKVG